MGSFRTAVNNRFGGGGQISTLNTAQKLPCPIGPPVSMRKLIRELNQETFTFPTWNFDGGYITGWTQVGVQADGAGSFRGHFHDSGPTGYNYVVIAALVDVKDESGRTLVFAHQGSVHGTLDIGSRDDDWQDDSFSCLVADNWDRLKTSRVQSGIHTSNDVLDVIEHVVAGILIGLGIDAFILFPPGSAFLGAVWTCTWFPGNGALVRCEGKPK